MESRTNVPAVQQSSCRRCAAYQVRWLARLPRPGAAALLVSSLVAAICIAAPSSASPKPEGQRFDARSVEELTLWYVTESYRRLHIPLVLRLIPGDKGPTKAEKIAEIRADPPRLQPDGRIHPFGPNNPLSLELDAASGSLTCWVRFSDKEGKLGGWGLSTVQEARGLNRYSSSHRRAGGEFAWDRGRDHLSLRRVYRTMPDREQFKREVDALLQAELKLSGDRFVKVMEKVLVEHEVPASATALRDGFEATMTVRHFGVAADQVDAIGRRYLRRWDRPAGHRAPRLLTDREIRLDQKAHVYWHFQGVVNGFGDAGTAIVEVDAEFSIRRPDGSFLVEGLSVPLWRGAAPPFDHLQIAMNDLSLTFEDESPGTYRLESRVCLVSLEDVCVDLVHPLVVR